MEPSTRSASCLHGFVDSGAEAGQYYLIQPPLSSVGLTKLSTAQSLAIFREPIATLGRPPDVCGGEFYSACYHCFEHLRSWHGTARCGNFGTFPGIERTVRSWKAQGLTLSSVNAYSVELLPAHSNAFSVTAPD